jgi:hypothetical protein
MPGAFFSAQNSGDCDVRMSLEELANKTRR